MAVTTKVNGRRISRMEQALNIGWMDKPTKDSIEMEANMVSASLNGTMVMYMKVNLKTIRWMAKVHSIGKVKERYIQGSGRIT